jgi:DNA-binding SARP family transcriptional activator
MGLGFEKEELADLGASEVDQLRQSNRSLQSDHPQPTASLLSQLWNLDGDSANTVANAAAWQQAWLRLKAGDYVTAAEWFERVDTLPGDHSQIESAQQLVLLRIARALVRLMDAPNANREHQTAPSSILAKLLPLTVTHLGGFMVRRGDELLPICRRRKPISLFRYLLSRNQCTAHREELMEALWPNVGPREAAHSLHVAVSALRQYLDHLPESYLMFVAGQYTINPQAVIEDDCRRFVQTNIEAESFWRSGTWGKAQQAYITAIDCYRGDYYVDGQDLMWAVAEREHLLTSYITALERLGHLWMTQRQFEAAAECYQRLLERDNYREDIHCQIMRCYLELGRRGEMIRQYQRCASVLASDLGLEPMPETQQFYRRAIGVE